MHSYAVCGKTLAMVVSLGVLLVSGHDVLAATITVANTDGANEGFNDPTPATPIGGNNGTTLGQQRLIAFQYAADLWAARVVPDQEIRVDASFDPLTCNSGGAELGHAGPNFTYATFPGAPRANTWYPSSLADQLAGFDLGSRKSDIIATFNSDIDQGCFPGGRFYYGLDGNQGSDMDFVTVLLHELGHGLGFLTIVSVNTGQKSNGLDDAFMLFLEDHSTGLLFPDMTDGERLTAITDTADLHWTGANVVAGAASLGSGVGGGGHVEIYAPSPVESGSSLSHFSKTLAPDELMEPQFTVPLHELDLSLALFEDIGYQTIVACGDANQDGKRSATDALIALKTAVGGASCVETLCDPTNDGKVSATDALKLLKAAVGQITDMVCGLRG